MGLNTTNVINTKLKLIMKKTKINNKLTKKNLASKNTFFISKDIITTKKLGN